MIVTRGLGLGGSGTIVGSGLGLYDSGIFNIQLSVTSATLNSILETPSLSIGTLLQSGIVSVGVSFGQTSVSSGVTIGADPTLVSASAYYPELSLGVGIVSEAFVSSILFNPAEILAQKQVYILSTSSTVSSDILPPFLGFGTGSLIYSPAFNVAVESPLVGVGAGSLIVVGSGGINTTLLLPEIYLDGSNLVVLNYRGSQISDIVFIGREDISINFDIKSISPNPVVEISKLAIEPILNDAISLIGFSSSVKNELQSQLVKITKEPERSQEVLILYTDEK